MFERISTNPNVCHGQACIKGTRIPVYLIVQMLANGDTIEELVEDYPSIAREEKVMQVLGQFAPEEWHGRTVRARDTLQSIRRWRSGSEEGSG